MGKKNPFKKGLDGPQNKVQLEASLALATADAARPRIYPHIPWGVERALFCSFFPELWRWRFPWRYL